ncbi:hypothetical protein EYC84_010250 [Monilinia fructicola]|uniref:Uncharacterized protein n=1 Tax=Monilinia fructicola TaxID=38448 RepID=A0A5M9JGV2_MONFR|nr:hypothetical protein EYC84_010250 [Monilinia fructicola]
MMAQCAARHTPYLIFGANPSPKTEQSQTQNRISSNEMGGSWDASLHHRFRFCAQIQAGNFVDPSACGPVDGATVAIAVADVS